MANKEHSLADLQALVLACIESGYEWPQIVKEVRMAMDASLIVSIDMTRNLVAGLAHTGNAEAAAIAARLQIPRL